MSTLQLVRVVQEPPYRSANRQLWLDLLDLLPSWRAAERVNPFHQDKTHERYLEPLCFPLLWDRTEPARLLVILDVAPLLSALDAFAAMGLDVTFLCAINNQYNTTSNYAPTTLRGHFASGST